MSITNWGKICAAGGLTIVRLSTKSAESLTDFVSYLFDFAAVTDTFNQ